MTERGTSGGMEIISTDLLGDVLIVVGEALGEMESQNVDLHKHNIGEAITRNVAAQERLRAAIGMLDTPNAKNDGLDAPMNNQTRDCVATVPCISLLADLADAYEDALENDYCVNGNCAGMRPVQIAGHIIREIRKANDMVTFEGGWIMNTETVAGQTVPLDSLVVCPECGGTLDFDMSDNPNDPDPAAWFFCTTTGCGFTCDAGIDDEGRYVPVAHNASPHLRDGAAAEPRNGGGDCSQ